MNSDIFGQFNQRSAFDGWTTDTDLRYEIGGFTDIEISAQRGIRVSESVTRDTLDYNIFGGVEATITYQRFNPLTMTFEAEYQNRKFYLITENTSMRSDDLYRISLGSDYQLRRWLAFSLNYSYRINQSDQTIQEYKENLIQAEIQFSI